MAPNISEAKFEVCQLISDQSEEDEAMSLRDLPLCLSEEGEAPGQPQETRISDPIEEFEFSRSGSDSQSTLPDMCAADDIFYQGQILPLRCSLDSICWTIDQANSPAILSSSARTQSITSCESMDRSCPRGLSLKSSSTNGKSNAPSPAPSYRTRTVIKQFHTGHPSPKPSSLSHSSSSKSYFTSRAVTRKSAFWEFFRLGLIRTNPADLTVRGLVNRTASSGTNSVSSGCTNCRVHSDEGNVTTRLTRSEEKTTSRRFRWSIFSGCSSTDNAVEPVLSNQNGGRSYVKEKICRTRTNVGKANSEAMKMKRREVSRYRTMEWIKELPHDSSIDHEELQISSFHSKREGK